MTAATATTTLTKQQAIRHLIHAAIRMLIEEEDPFAIHLLVQSADKLLIDMSKKLGKDLRMDWELYIKDEFQDQFFEQYRAISNFLKHADRDSEIPITDIMTRNVFELFTAIANYTALFLEKTNHMIFFQIFLMQLHPNFFKIPDELRGAYMQSVGDFQYLTPREFFDLVKSRHDLLPRYLAEQVEDRHHVGDFYTLNFKELRCGIKDNPRKIRIP